MKTNDKNKPIEVFSGTTWQAGMVKSLLEDSEIEAFMQDVIMGTLNPWYTAPGGAGSVRVFVADHNYEKAKTIVVEYEKNMKENN
jgi:hypothetical protein